jgi:hypothetical protein
MYVMVMCGGKRYITVRLRLWNRQDGTAQLIRLSIFPRHTRHDCETNTEAGITLAQQLGQLKWWCIVAAVHGEFAALEEATSNIQGHLVMRFSK